MKSTILVALIACLLYASPAMAYIDPGSGSAIISAIIGFFVAVGLAIKTYSYKIKSFFTRKAPVESTDEPDTSPQG